MIATAKCGNGFGGLTRYLLQGRKDDPHPERVAWTSTRELALEEPRHAASLMHATASQGRAQDPVEHFSISLAPGEHLTREQWDHVVDTSLRHLGLEGHQALVVAHRDTAQEHIHIMVNRVHPETHRTWNRWQDRPRVMESLRPQELALGLRVTPHVEDPDRLPDALVRRFERTGELPFLDYARAAGRPVIAEARTWSELHEGLAEQGLYLQRKGQGLVFTDDRHHVKASSVDRSASLRALEGRLGPYEERRPLLQEVGRDLRAEYRERELTAELAPLYQARQEASRAAADRAEAARQLDCAGAAVRSTVADAYRDPFEAANRYLAHLNAGRSPVILPTDLGKLQGSVLHAGRNYLPLGAEGEKAYRIATERLPQRGARYQQARETLGLRDAQLTATRRQVEQLEQRYRPQLAELAQLGSLAQRGELPERVMSLRPRDQIALARSHGAEVLTWSAERAPKHVGRTTAAREWWLKNLAPQLDNALSRQLSQRGIPLPTPGKSPPVGWMVNAVRRGLPPAHGTQALVRAGFSLGETLHATSRALSLTRAVVGNPVKTAARVAAQALGLPSLPVRLAVAALSVARSVGRALIR